MISRINTTNAVKGLFEWVFESVCHPIDNIIRPIAEAVLGTRLLGNTKSPGSTKALSDLEERRRIRESFRKIRLYEFKYPYGREFIYDKLSLEHNEEEFSTDEQTAEKLQQEENPFLQFAENQLHIMEKELSEDKISRTTLKSIQATLQYLESETASLTSQHSLDMANQCLVPAPVIAPQQEFCPVGAFSNSPRTIGSSGSGYLALEQ